MYFHWIDRQPCIYCYFSLQCAKYWFLNSNCFWQLEIAWKACSCFCFRIVLWYIFFQIWNVVRHFEYSTCSNIMTLFVLEWYLFGALCINASNNNYRPLCICIEELIQIHCVNKHVKNTKSECHRNIWYVSPNK